MEPAASRLREKLAGVEIRPARCRVWSNVTGRPHHEDAASVRDLLVKQLTSPVRWADCCRGVVSNAEGSLHEVAPGRTLSGLMRRIDRSHKVESHDEP
jgi:[acyl-carrier-protein] S-malonyltransferase